MTPDFQLQLGDFVFQDLEIPEEIPFGGEHRLAVHELIGGKRIIDALGRSDTPLEWNGLLFGENALDRAKYLDYLRVQGKALSLTWSSLSYTVIIREFKCKFDRQYKLPYSIVCIVVQDLGQPVTSLPQDSIDGAINDDANAADDAAGFLSEAATVAASSIQTAIAAIKTAIGKVSSIAKATNDQILAIKTPIQDAQLLVTTTIAAVANTMQNVTTMGGILPNNPVSTNTASLLSQVAAYNNQAQLMNLKYTLDRMDRNMSTVGTPSTTRTRTVNAINPNLYAMAKQYYGDATKWTLIAKANGLTDPQPQGIMTLIIPQDAAGTGGILA